MRSFFEEFIALPLVALVMIVGCSEAAQEQAAGPKEHAGEHEAREGGHAHAELPDHVTLSAEVIAAAKIESAPARMEVIAPIIRATGQIEADPARTMQVAAKVAGVVESVAFREGDVVAEGQTLATIRAPGLASMRADVAALQARGASARANLTRLEAMAQRDMASLQELAAARAEATALAAEASAAQQRLRALGLGSRGAAPKFELRAPRAGFVIRRGVVAGQSVLAEQQVATIVDLEKAWFMAHVFEHQLARVRVGAAAAVELNAYPGELFTGTIEFLSPIVEADSGTIVARIVIDNREAMLRIGLFGTVEIAAPSEASAVPVLVVPRSAITDVTGKTSLFVQAEDGVFELHEVTLGASGPGLVEVVQGLHEGERVVTRGAWTLKSVLLRGTFGEDHD